MHGNDVTVPLIGITTYGRNRRNAYFLMAEYLEAVRHAGGVPVLLAPGEARIEVLLHRLDGLILAGGGDIAPKRFGRESHPAVAQVDPERDEFEFRLARLWLETPKPVLGICRGMQLLAILAGGDLILDIPTQYPAAMEHRRENVPFIEHVVKIVPDSRLYGTVEQARVPVASLHHQAVAHTGDGWRITAKAPDGIIEAMERADHPWAVAVQWHPELMPDHPAHQALFREFVKAAAESKVNSPHQAKPVEKR